MCMALKYKKIVSSTQAIKLLSLLQNIFNIETISKAVAHKKNHGFFKKVQAEEIAQHVAQITGMDPQQHIDLIECWFSNPEIVDAVGRVGTYV